MGCSPYFAVTGTHPLLPLDISEATYLLPGLVMIEGSRQLQISEKQLNSVSQSSLTLI
ncbi:hypothetical protein B0H10DRAFT_1248119 [Mycena sp. CBHHK59/15]|nr:hypothetical protein B0H10DRAFT_1248119 [Mycena sp. CBHHK59/15]